MPFKKGDIVLMNPDAEVNKRQLSARLTRILKDNIEMEVLDYRKEGNEEYYDVRVTIDDVTREITVFTDRVMLAKRDIVEGCFVSCVEPRRSSILAKGTVYRVDAMSEKDGAKLIRVSTNKRAIRHAFPVEMFVYYSKDAPKDWNVVVVEPWEEKFLDKLASGNHLGVCSFAIMHEDDTEEITRDGPCHAAFGNYYGNNGKKKIKAVALCFSRFYNKMSEEQKPGYKRFLNYIVNESPMKDCFIPRTADDLVKNGVMMNVAKSTSEITVAAVATRHYTEFAAKGKVFDEVMDMGFEGNVAMFVSTFFDKRGEDMCYNNFGGGHSFMANTLDYKSLFSFFKNGFDPELLPQPYKPMAEGRTSYRILKTVAKLSARNEYDIGPGAITDYVKTLKGITKGLGGPFGGEVNKLTGKNSLIRLCAAVSKEV